ncbi:two component transcriptional regulator, LuxR family [Geodermatophilus saharensis]|uniref:Two component transcriptional regulator, LuxR family n=1 Tax=Geodermatophilus saharensis TaxID=1137994 RepID=A0A239B5B5_9ACTN|nr:response regulator transcription factor [Geodermatophilus saharensis]SNS02433.1 two component transcriptional regulator, LuxR family [Geodermatophilus saharensis]
MAAVPRSIRVFLVDDHEVVRRGVAELLEDDPALVVVGEAGTAAEALARGPAVRPDVAIVDMRLPDGDGADVVRALRERVPGCCCLVLSSYADDDAVAAALAAGAAGYLVKQVRGADLVSAVHTVAAGGTLVAAPGRPSRDGADRRLAGLTEQERTVLGLIGEGLTNRQIGDRMGLAEKTVKNYTSHLLAKLGLERRTQAAILATELRGRRPGG